MSSLFERVKEIQEYNSSMKEVMSVPKEMVKDYIKDCLYEEDLEKAKRLIVVTSELVEGDLERLLYEKDVVPFYYGLQEETGLKMYVFPEIEIEPVFSFENVMQEFRDYCDENEKLLSKSYFCFSSFTYLKEKNLIPYEYNLYAASNYPEDSWSAVKHYVLYKNDTPLYSKRLKDIFKVLSRNENRVYMDLELIEKWAEDIFKIIEKHEKKKK